MIDKLAIWYNKKWTVVGLDPNSAITQPNGSSYYRMHYPFRIYDSTQPLWVYKGQGTIGDYLVVDGEGEFILKLKADYEARFPTPLTAQTQAQLFGGRPKLSSRSLRENPNLISEVARELTGRRSNRTSGAVPAPTVPGSTFLPSPSTPSLGGGGY